MTFFAFNFSLFQHLLAKCSKLTVKSSEYFHLYGNQPISLRSKSVDWVLYGGSCPSTSFIKISITV